ncbi:glutathione transferase GstA [Microbulbifer sp. 2205BS26-8]|uniref:glutathione transferase GstA n=1 Tax=Microbulbifer sp. 2205BS26-8 TaxID=3064386 RepID=UPI00273DD631|nr:glutathione transferase GstA [Microbulbifer sp. 2205BS26-8]MDP5209608.1 glutathione transferase GstA [Microbulbifer sp. 2205BS26-8]
MKLFYAPGACSLSPHIVAREADINLDLCKVDLETHTLENGDDFRKINPKGYVPALQLDGGEILTEGAAIVQFLAEQKPDANLVPPVGTLAHYRMLEWLNFLSAEVHELFKPLFWNGPEEEQQRARENLIRRFDYIEKHLDKGYLMGGEFTVPDAYLYVLSTWLESLQFDMSRWPRLQSFKKRMAERPEVQRALEEENGKSA